MTSVIAPRGHDIVQRPFTEPDGILQLRVAYMVCVGGGIAAPVGPPWFGFFIWYYRQQHNSTVSTPGLNARRRQAAAASLASPSVGP